MRDAVAEGGGRRPAGLDRPRDDRARRRAPPDRRDRRARHRRRARDARRRHRPRRPPAAPRRSPQMDDFVRTMHTKSGLLPEIEALDAHARRRRRAGARVHRRARARRRTAPMCGNSIGVDRRFLDRYLPEPRRVPALPQHRRVVAEGAVPALVPRRLPRAAGQGRGAPRARRHPRVDRELRYYREAILRPPEGAAEVTAPPS